MKDEWRLKLECLRLAKELFPNTSADSDAMLLRARVFVAYCKEDIEGRGELPPGPRNEDLQQLHDVPGGPLHAGNGADPAGNDV